MSTRVRVTLDLDVPDPPVAPASAVGYVRGVFTGDTIETALRDVFNVEIVKPLVALRIMEQR